MGAFDSIKMGYRCKAWTLQSDVPSAFTTVISRRAEVPGQQWIINATVGNRRMDVKQGSTVVLDGGPRWVLSTALGFLTGGLWWTALYTVLFALANYAMCASTAYAPWGSGTEAAGIIACIILAAVLSMASIPGAWLVAGFSEWKVVASGLVVEMSLCCCVTVSLGVVHSLFRPHLEDNQSLSLYVDSGRWGAPALVWVAASKLREKAMDAARTKLANLWCSHPMTTFSTSLPISSLWNDWSADVEECARRVGGYGMLGFSASDLAVLTDSTPSPNALKVIQKLRSSLGENASTIEPWIRQSSAFVAGYDSRIRIRGPTTGCATIPLRDIKNVIRSLSSGDHPKVDSYKKEIKASYQGAMYVVSTEENDERWFYAGAFMADSDQREDSVPTGGKYGSRLAVSLALLVEGTDSVARLACYAESKLPESSVQLLSYAISLSTGALVSELAHAAGVTNADALGMRGLAYATGDRKSLAYSPDEMVAASHLQETIVISDDTFSALAADKIFETLWAGSANVEKRVDISDMVPLLAGSPSEAAASEAGASACLGWLCHLGFTLAMLTVHLSGQTFTGLVVLGLVGIPATDKRVSVHMKYHHNMIHISYLLNYIRCCSRWFSLSPRGKATIDKADHCGVFVFLFVNILPAVACIVYSGWKWWVAFIPCMLANLPGLLNTICYGWASAFKYEWWSWHVPNRWLSGFSYLKDVNFRKRVGKNVLSVNSSSSVMEVGQVQPLPGSLSSQIRFMVVGGRS